MSTNYDDINFSQEDVPRKPVELHPRGQCKSICVDAIDLGLQENTFKKNDDGSPLMERRIRIVWETSRMRADGIRHFTISRSFKLSLYDGANGGNPAALYVVLSSWLGAAWDGQFRSADIVGREAELFIEHEKGRKDKTKTFAKILAVHPLEDGQNFQASGLYKRFVDKSAPKNDAAPQADEEEVPF